jgi:hypothetical protein
MKIRLFVSLLILILSITSCVSSKKNPTAGRYSGKQSSYMDAVSMKKRPVSGRIPGKTQFSPDPVVAKKTAVRKNFIIRNAETNYLGQQSPR